MRRYMLAAVGVAVGVAILGADQPKPVPFDPKRGEKLRVTLDYQGALAPAFPSMQAYKNWLRAVKTGNPGSIKADADAAAMLTPVDVAEVISIPEASGAGFVYRADVAEILVVSGPSKGVTGFLPIQYARPKDAVVPTYENPLPLFALVREAKYLAKPGDQAVAYDDDVESVFAVSDLLAYDRYVTLALAKDYVGLKGMVAAGSAAKIDTGTPIHVIQRIEDRLVGKGVPAVEARVGSGPLEGKAVWLAETFVTKLRIGVRPNPRAKKR